MTSVKALTTLALLWLVVAVNRVGADMVVQTCFSPTGKCAAHIVREIGLAKKELLIAVYAFTSEELAGAVVQARKRGVAVQVVIDREFDLRNGNSKGKYLDAHKVPLRRVSGKKAGATHEEAGIMHQKFAIIDRRTLLTGSYNWTGSANSRNDENLLLFREAGPLAEQYRKAFLALWERKS